MFVGVICCCVFVLRFDDVLLCGACVCVVCVCLFLVVDILFVVALNVCWCCLFVV